MSEPIDYEALDALAKSYVNREHKVYPKDCLDLSEGYVALRADRERLLRAVEAMARDIKVGTAETSWNDTDVAWAIAQAKEVKG